MGYLLRVGESATITGSTINTSINKKEVEFGEERKDEFVKKEKINFSVKRIVSI
jgi:hypothetical protein